MRALVTGASGHIGGHLVRALVRRGDEVACLVRPTSRTGPLRGQQVSLVEGDLRDRSSLIPAVRDRDVVFHLGAVISAPDRQAFEAANVLGTGNLVEACLEAAPGLKRFVMVSSIAAAGPSPEGRALDEDDDPSPISDYGRSKLAAEKLVLAAQGRLPAIILRPPNVLGPGLPELEMAIRMVRGRIAPSLGDGRPQTSLVDVDDLVQAMILAAEDPRGVGRTYFVTDGRAYAWEEVIGAIRVELGVRGPIVPIPYVLQFAAAWLSEKAARVVARAPRLSREIVRAGRKYRWIYDGSRLERELGFHAARSLRDSIHRAVEAARPGRSRRRGKGKKR